MDGGQVLGRAGRQGAVELGQRPRGGQRFGPLDQVAFELAPQVALEAGQLRAVDRRPLLAVLAGRLVAGGEPERAPDPLHVDADHAGALAAAEGGDRQPRQVAHGVLVAGRHRLADLLAQLVDVDLVAACLAGALALAALADLAPLTLLGDPVLDRLGLGGAEEVAVEEQLEDAAVVLGLGDRRGQRLAEVVLRGPADLFERREGVEDLRGADRDPLAAQFLAEAEQLRRQPRRAGVGLGTVGRDGAHRSDNRPMRAGRAEGGAEAALREMRSARRRRYVERLDVMEVLYRVYVGAIFAAIALALLAGAVNEAAATPAAIEWLRAPRSGGAGPRRRRRRRWRGCAAAPAAGRWRSRRPRSSTSCWHRWSAARCCGPRRCGSCGSASSPGRSSASCSATSSSAACRARRSSGSPAWRCSAP